MEELITFLFYIFTVIFVYWRGFINGIAVGVQEKNPMKVYNVEVDEQEDTVLFYNMQKDNEFLFQARTYKEGMNKLRDMLPEKVTIIVSRVDKYESL